MARRNCCFVDIDCSPQATRCPLRHKHFHSVLPSETVEPLCNLSLFPIQWLPLRRHASTLLLCLASTAMAAVPVPVDEDYNQWKQALGVNAATSAAHLTALPGFKVELIRSAQSSEGSW